MAEEVKNEESLNQDEQKNVSLDEEKRGISALKTIMELLYSFKKIYKYFEKNSCTKQQETVVENFQDQVKDVVEDVLEDVVEDVKDQVEDVVESIKDQVEDVEESIKDQVEDVVEEVLEDVVEEVKDQVEDVAKDIAVEVAKSQLESILLQVENSQDLVNEVVVEAENA